MPRPGRFSPWEEIRFALCRRLCGPQDRCGRLRKISPPTGIRSPDRSACSSRCSCVHVVLKILKEEGCDMTLTCLNENVKGYDSNGVIISAFSHTIYGIVGALFGKGVDLRALAC